MAEPTRYRVTVKSAFVCFDQLFQPDRKYTVSKRVYESMVGDKAFKDLCASAEPLAR